MRAVNSTEADKPAQILACHIRCGNLHKVALRQLLALQLHRKAIHPTQFPANLDSMQMLPSKSIRKQASHLTLGRVGAFRGRVFLTTCTWPSTCQQLGHQLHQLEPVQPNQAVVLGLS